MISLTCGDFVEIRGKIYLVFRTINGWTLAPKNRMTWLRLKKRISSVVYCVWMTLTVQNVNAYVRAKMQYISPSSNKIQNIKMYTFSYDCVCFGLPYFDHKTLLFVQKTLMNRENMSKKYMQTAHSKIQKATRWNYCLLS